MNLPALTMNQASLSTCFLQTHKIHQGTEPFLISADNILNLSELQFIDNSLTQLIVLSACNTGIGEFMKGEGIFSLARAFAAAGIPSGINSLWKIDDQTNYQITEQFHKYVSQGLPTDKALQQAKIDFMDNRDTFDKLPYFWGSTVLVGPSLRFKTTDLLWVWLSLGILVLGCSIGLIWWRYN